jgi:hypothetical protein
MGKFIHSERIYNDRYGGFLIGFGSRYAGGCTSGHPFQVCLIYNGHHFCDLLFLRRIDYGKFYFTFYSFTLKNYSICKDQNTDFETRSLDTVCVNESELEHKWHHNIKYLVVGVLFGILFIKAEVISWYRIQEMFRFQSFHMYGLIGSAVVVELYPFFL